MNQPQALPSPKLCARSALRERAAELPQPVVFTNGVFDLLHRGHVEYLAEARRLGASLVVGVNSDASTRRLGKGEERPINPASDRAAVLAALACVDLVVVFDEDTPAALLDELRPPIYAKGGDYTLERLPEAAQVRQWGGRAVVLGHRPGCSTTALIERLRRTGAPALESPP